MIPFPRRAWPDIKLVGTAEIQMVTGADGQRHLRIKIDWTRPGHDMNDYGYISWDEDQQTVFTHPNDFLERLLADITFLAVKAERRRKTESRV